MFVLIKAQDCGGFINSEDCRVIGVYQTAQDAKDVMDADVLMTAKDTDDVRFGTHNDGMEYAFVDGFGECEYRIYEVKE